ncbi:hypothetical protein J6590_011281 [Homalodisca vitripennis]|nr:hypothetical protein J6590_011281 [Homalodisca vitripennis]
MTRMKYGDYGHEIGSCVLSTGPLTARSALRNDVIATGRRGGASARRDKCTASPRSGGSVSSGSCGSRVCGTLPGTRNKKQIQLGLGFDNIKTFIVAMVGVINYNLESRVSPWLGDDQDSVSTRFLQS